MPIPRLSLERTALLVIDVQERLLPTIHDAEGVVANCSAALELAKVLGAVAAGLQHEGALAIERARDGVFAGRGLAGQAQKAVVGGR